MVLTEIRKKPAIKLLEWWLVFLVALLPLAWISYAAYSFQLGADPAKEIVLFTGLWALRCLWITLAVTPLRRLFGWGGLMRFRRMLGLYTTFYATLHLLAFATFILGWRWDLLVTEVLDRPYVFVGVAAFLLLIPLTVTSTKAMQRRLGKRWLTLHKSVYLIAALVMVHFIWLIRDSYAEVLLYGAILSFLLGYRVYKSKWFSANMSINKSMLQLKRP